MLAIKGISAAASVVGTLAAAQKQNEAYAQNAQSAKDAYFLKSKQSNLKILQEQRQASQQKLDADAKAMKAQSTSMAAAAASGVQGVDVDRMLNDFERSEGVLSDRISQRLEGMQAQNEMNKLAFQTEANNRINSMQPVGFAETLFNVVEPIAGFSLDYMDEKNRLATLEGN
jgi:transposase-like protein